MSKELLTKFQSMINTGGDKDLARMRALEFLRQHGDELTANGVDAVGLRKKIAGKLRGAGTVNQDPGVSGFGENALNLGGQIFLEAPGKMLDATLGPRRQLEDAKSGTEAAGLGVRENLRAAGELAPYLLAGAFLGPAGAIGAMTIPVAGRVGEIIAGHETVDEETGQKRQLKWSDLQEENPAAGVMSTLGNVAGAFQGQAAGVKGPEGDPLYAMGKAALEGEVLRGAVGARMMYDIGAAGAGLSPRIANVREQSRLRRLAREASDVPSVTPDPARQINPETISQLPERQMRVDTGETPAALPRGMNAEEVLSEVATRIDKMVEDGVEGAAELQARETQLFQEVGFGRPLDAQAVAKLKADADRLAGVAPATPAASSPTRPTEAPAPRVDKGAALQDRIRPLLEKLRDETDPAARSKIGDEIERVEKAFDKTWERDARYAQMADGLGVPDPIRSPGAAVPLDAVGERVPIEAAGAPSLSTRDAFLNSHRDALLRSGRGSVLPKNPNAVPIDAALPEPPRPPQPRALPPAAAAPQLPPGRTEQLHALTRRLMTSEPEAAALLQELMGLAAQADWKARLPIRGEMRPTGPGAPVPPAPTLRAPQAPRRGGLLGLGLEAGEPSPFVNSPEAAQHAAALARLVNALNPKQRALLGLSPQAIAEFNRAVETSTRENAGRLKDADRRASERRARENPGLKIDPQTYESYNRGQQGAPAAPAPREPRQKAIARRMAAEKQAKQGATIQGAEAPTSRRGSTNTTAEGGVENVTSDTVMDIPAPKRSRASIIGEKMLANRKRKQTPLNDDVPTAKKKGDKEKKSPSEGVSPYLKGATMVAGAVTAGLIGREMMRDDDDEGGDKKHMAMKLPEKSSWTDLAAVPVGLSTLIPSRVRRVKAAIAAKARPILNAMKPKSAIPHLPENRVRQEITKADFDDVVGTLETKIKATRAFPTDMGARVGARTNAVAGQLHTSDFMNNTGVVPGVMEFTAKSEGFKQKVYDNVLEKGAGNLEAEVGYIGDLDEGVRRTMNLMIEGRPVKLADRAAFEARSDAGRLRGYVQRLRKVYRAAKEWRQAREESVIEGDYAPHSAEPWMSALLDEAGGNARNAQLRDESSLSHQRKTLFDPNRNPLDNLVSYVNAVENKAMNQAVIKPIIEARKRYERAGFQAEADTLNLFIENTLNAKKNYLDAVMSDAIVSEIKSKAANVQPGTRVELDGNWGLPEGELVVKKHGGRGQRGENFYVEVNGKEWPHPYTSAEISFLQYANSVTGRFKLGAMHNPVSRMIGSMTKLASFSTMWLNTRSVASQIAGNIGRVWAGDETVKGLAQGAAKTAKLFKDYLTNRDAIRGELQRLQRYELIDGDRLRAENPNQAFKAIDTFFELPGIRHGFVPLKAPDLAFKLTTFYAAEARLTKEHGRSWTKSQIERAAVAETLRLTDHSMRLLQSPLSRHVLMQLVTFLKKSSLREIQQVAEIYKRKRPWAFVRYLAAKAGIGAAAYYMMGLDNDEIAEVVSRLIPMGDVIAGAAEFGGLTEARDHQRGDHPVPAYDILRRRIWTVRDAVAKDIEAGRVPGADVLEAALPVPFRTMRNIEGALTHPDARQRELNLDALFISRNKANRPEATR